MAELDPENTLVLETTKGKATIALRPDLAPNHVARIKELARQGFYDGTPFHRVIDGFMAQGGDPTGTGTGGSGKKLKAEFSPRSISAASARWRARRAPIPPTASSSSASPTRPGSTSNTRCGAGWSTAWTMSTRSSAASRSRIPTRSCR